MRIKITKDGPYLVSGNIPIRELIITPKGHHYVFTQGRTLPQAETYALCRCGHSNNAPFCDGAHAACAFQGKETASRAPYRNRAEESSFGETITLLDDRRCAFARFCHTEYGDVWSVTEDDYDPDRRKAAIEAAHACPAGRLVMVDEAGNEIEEPTTPEIIIMQDPEKQCSAAIFVKGPITVESEDGTEYEVRNRVALCRCGHSSNKPFCEASHVRFGYNDGHLPTL